MKKETRLSPWLWPRVRVIEEMQRKICFRWEKETVSGGEGTESDGRGPALLRTLRTFSVRREKAHWLWGLGSWSERGTVPERVLEGAGRE